MQNYGDLGASTETTISNFKKRISEVVKFGAEDFADSVGRLTEKSLEVNKVFGQGRQRLQELRQSIADTLPELNKFGGKIEDVAVTLADIAEASRRNVVADTQSVKDLFIASKVLGQSAEVISESFLDVGINISKIGENFEGAMEYVQSIGGNVRDVLDKMRMNMDQLNRFQFQGGVIGLTKMAAQASMLRFDMNQTFNLADKVLDPEGAIEVASAFQRLGVAAGNLVDPFQLMNQSITDPSGLQNSLADVAKQFTYFDEKTKTFKINPQGVLTLKEMEKQTNVSASEMSKLGLATADLDRRLSTIRSAGLTLASEEDKQYLANIASMTREGEYVVTIRDDKGKAEMKNLADVTQDELEKLIDQQKTGPKNLEEFARSQMSIQQIMQGDLTAIRSVVVGSVGSSQVINQGLEQLRDLVERTGNRATGAFPTTAEGRATVDEQLRKVGDFISKLADPNTNKMELLSESADNVRTYFENFGTKVTKEFDNIVQNIREEFQKGKSIASAKASEYLRQFAEVEPTPQTGADTTRTAQASARVRGGEVSTQIIQHKVDMDDVNIKITGNQNFTEGQLQQITQVITQELRKIQNIKLYQSATKQPKPGERVEVE